MHCPSTLLFCAGILVLFADIPAGALGSTPPGEDLEHRVDAFVAAVLGCRNIVGMNLAVVKGTDMLITKGYGTSNLERQTLVTKDTLFSVASLTKSFTTAVLGQILKDKGLSWDYRVRDILGNDFFFHNGLLSNQTTLRDLATHTTGIPSHNYARLQRLTRAELAAKIRFLQPVRDLRTSFFYSNLMYGLLSYVVDELTGNTWEAEVVNRLFKPLRMDTSTFIETADLERPDLATPYLPDAADGNKMRPISQELQRAWGGLGGSGAILSTASDMARYLAFHLREGRNETGSVVIDDDVIRETHDGIYVIPQTASTKEYKRPNIPVTYDHGKYGLGWRDGYYRGWRMLLHTGSTWGYGALMTLLPDAELGVYMSVNGPDDGYYGRRLTSLYIMDLLLGETPWLNETSACDFPYKTEQNAASFTYTDDEEADISGSVDPSEHDSSSSEDLSDYTGQYGNFAYGNISIELENDDELHLHYGDLGHWRLVEKTRDVFLGVGQGAMWSLNVSTITFVRKDNRPHRVTLALETKDPPVFTRDLQMSDAPPPPDPEQCGTEGPERNTSTPLTLGGATLTAYIAGLLYTAYN